MTGRPVCLYCGRHVSTVYAYCSRHARRPRHDPIRVVDERAAWRRLRQRLQAVGLVDPEAMA